MLGVLGLLAALAAGGIYVLADSVAAAAAQAPAAARTSRSAASPPTTRPRATARSTTPHAGLATDGNPLTFWDTETYATPAFGGLKDGVGLVLDAGSAVALHALKVSTDTPGFTAVIRAGDAPDGPFSDDSPSQTVDAETTFALDGRTARYYVLWITNLGTVDSVHVNEVSGS